MTFITLPIVVFFLYQIQKKIGEIKLLKYVYIILIFYSWLRLFQFDIVASLLNILFITIFFIFFYSKKNFFANQNLLILYLIFSSYYYFQTSVDFRKYKDVNIYNRDLIFDGSKIDEKFKNVQWITSYGINQDDEIKSINYKINLLKDLTLDQEKFNSLISQLISNMSLDENINEEEKRDEENDNDDKQSKPQNQEQKTKEKDVILIIIIFLFFNFKCFCNRFHTSL